MINRILNVDSYKASHFLQYPPETYYVSSYIESRGGEFTSSVFFGLQLFLKEYLSKPISQRDIDEAEEILTLHGEPFNRSGWQHILKEHQGYFPLEIQAVAEGTVLPAQNVMVQIINTDPQCAWLTSYLETALLRAIWYPTTVATFSWHGREIIKKYLLETADSIDSLPFKLHDFGARGVSSEASASIGGLAHLISFQGTDTVSAIVAARKYYGSKMAGFSIPAAEHGTITAWGVDQELNAYTNMLQQFSGPGKVVAVVSDSYNLWHAIDSLWGEKLKEQVIHCGGTIVLRPDSGDPVGVVVEMICRLMDKFGYTTNSKGYKVLPNYIRVIQGDGISLESMELILATMKEHCLSADNVAFGMGASLLQKVNRDTLKFAMKVSSVNIAGQWRDVYKDPITDPNKRSKQGRLALVKDEVGNFHTIREEDLAGQKNELLTVFSNGKLLHEWTLDEIRQNCQQTLIERN